jgi:hypothetical protein
MTAQMYPIRVPASKINWIIPCNYLFLLHIWLNAKLRLGRIENGWLRKDDKIGG